MSYTVEQMQQASIIFFQLLKRKTIELKENVVEPYLEIEEVRDALHVIAAEAGTEVLQTPERLHLITRAQGSIFASSFTQMKRNYSQLETKKYFYTINLIILVFLAEVDVEDVGRMHWENNSISYYQLEKQVHTVLDRWKKEEEISEDWFSKDWAIAVDDMIEVWDNTPVDEEGEGKEREGRLTSTRKTHIGLIHTAMRLLKDENLVYIVEEEKRVIPRVELYERLEGVYHNQTRYQEMKRLVERSLTQGGES